MSTKIRATIKLKDNNDIQFLTDLGITINTSLTEWLVILGDKDKIESIRDHPNIDKFIDNRPLFKCQ